MFLEYLVPVIEDIEYPVLIEYWIQNSDASAYKESTQRCKVTINEEEIYRNYETEFLTESIMESLNWLSFLGIMEFNADSIDHNKKIL